MDLSCECRKRVDDDFLHDEAKNENCWPSGQT
jgi:hypothetical protein